MPKEDATGEEGQLCAAGRLRIDPNAFTVVLDAKPVELGGRAFALLLVLMRHPMKVLSKDALIEQVWDSRAVSDAVLTTTVRELRQALGDDAKRPSWIKTEHGRGYRFIAPVDTPSSSASSPEENLATATEPELLVAGGVMNDGPGGALKQNRPASNWRIPVTALTLSALAILALAVVLFQFLPGESADSDPGAQTRSVAVLTFEDLGTEDELDWFANGLTQEITNALGRIPDLRVASRRASEAAEALGVSPREIGESLGVAHLVEGSVRLDGDTIRVSVALINARDGLQLWSNQYDRQLDDLLSVQSEISTRIAQLLETTLDPATLSQMAEAGTKSIAAYEAYLRGEEALREFSQLGSHEPWIEAGDYMDRARSIDPEFAEAHAAAAHIYRYINTPSLVMRPDPDTGDVYRREYTARMDAAIEHARDETEALAYRARRDQEMFVLSEAANAYEAYLRARPNDIERLFDYSDTLVMLGRLEEAREVVARLDTLIPHSDTYSRSWLIQHATKARDFERAGDLARDVIARTPYQSIALLEAHTALLRVGTVEEVADLTARIQASEVGRFAKIFAQMRLQCMRGNVDEVLEQSAIFLAEERAINMGYHVLSMLGRAEDAHARLRPRDAPGLPGSIRESLFEPSFDRTRLPNLAQALRDTGAAFPEPADYMVSCPAP